MTVYPDNGSDGKHLSFLNTGAHALSIYFNFYLFSFGRTESSLLCMGFLPVAGAGATLRFQWPRLLQSAGSRSTGFSSFQHTGSVAAVHGLVVPWHMESSWTRHRTRVPSIGRWILSSVPPGSPTSLSFYFRLGNIPD